LWLLAEDRGLLPVFKMNADGSGFTKAYSAGTSSSLDAGPGTVVFLNETFSRPAELFVLDSKTGNTRQLTHLNDELLAKLDFGKVESLTFTGAGDRQIQQWLIYPPGYDPAKNTRCCNFSTAGRTRWSATLLATAGTHTCSPRRVTSSHG